MSVTITISGNMTYCQEHNLVEESDGIEYYPYEMNLSNGNFSTFANSLGLIEQEEDMWAGEVYPQKVLQLLKSFDPELAVRGQTEEFGKKGARIINCGLRDEQVHRYCELLTIMCEEAERREEKIVWC